MALLLLVLATGVLAGVDPAWSTGWSVDRFDDTEDVLPGDGRCIDAGGRCSLRAALMEANAWPGSDRIDLPAGGYLLSRAGADENLGSSGDLDITDSVEVVGAGSATTHVDAAALDGIVDVIAGQVALSGLTLRNGRMNDVPLGTLRGIGLNVAAGATVVLDDLTLTGNDLDTDALGNGLAGGIGSLGCVVGRGVRVVDNPTVPTVPSLEDRCMRVGAVAVRGPTACLDLLDFELSRNCGSYASLHLDDFATATLRRGLIADNSGSGPASIVVNIGNSLVLENVSIVHNRQGAALMNDGYSDVRIINGSIVGNRSANSGPGGGAFGGIVDVHGVPRVRLVNTIVQDNGSSAAGSDCTALQLEGGNRIGNPDGCRLFGASATDAMGRDPGLGPLLDHGGFTPSMMPGWDSIDSGVDEGCPSDDQRGALRPQDGDADAISRCDRGAHEIGPEAFVDGFEAQVRRAATQRSRPPGPARDRIVMAR